MCAGPTGDGSALPVSFAATLAPPIGQLHFSALTPARHGTSYQMLQAFDCGGRFYKDAVNGNGLIWCHMLAVNAPNLITLSGFIAPPFGGPATSLLPVTFAEEAKPTL